MTAPARATGRGTTSAAGRTSATGTTKTRPLLWVLPRPAQGRPLAPFVVLMLVLLVVGLVSLLLLNTWSSQDAFRLHTMQAQQNTLDDDEQALQQQVQNATDPLTLAARAQALGLVPAAPPVFVKEVTPGHYVLVGTKHTVKGTRIGSLLVIPAKTPPKPPVAVVTTTPAVAPTAPAVSATTAPVPSATTAPVPSATTVTATSAVPVANTPASAVTNAAAAPTGAVHG